MLFIIIFALIIVLFFIFWIVFKSTKKSKKTHQKIEINFEDIDSLNVSKIIIDENDIEFLRNEFWFKFKQKQVLNQNCFIKLKKHFETENNLKVSDFALNVSNNETETIELINIVTSDSNSKEDIAIAFFQLEQRIYHK